MVNNSCMNVISLAGLVVGQVGYESK